MSSGYLFTAHEATGVEATDVKLRTEATDGMVAKLRNGMEAYGTDECHAIVFICVLLIDVHNESCYEFTPRTSLLVASVEPGRPLSTTFSVSQTSQILAMDQNGHTDGRKIR